MPLRLACPPGRGCGYPPKAVQPQRAASTSSLWTLKSLRFGPDDAAANAHREENHDPQGRVVTPNKGNLTEEMRLESGSELARVCSLVQHWSVQPCVGPPRRLFHHLVGGCEQRRRHCEAERPPSLAADGQLELDVSGNVLCGLDMRNCFVRVVHR
jgi:hypothetical protein